MGTFEVLQNALFSRFSTLVKLILSIVFSYIFPHPWWGYTFSTAMYKVLAVEDFEGLWTFRVVGLLMFLSKGVLCNSNMKTPVSPVLGILF